MNRLIQHLENKTTKPKYLTKLDQIPHLSDEEKSDLERSMKSLFSVQMTTTKA